MRCNASECVVVCVLQDGTCALYCACECGATKSVRLLLSASANPGQARLVRYEVAGSASGISDTFPAPGGVQLDGDGNDKLCGLFCFLWALGILRMAAHHSWQL